MAFEPAALLLDDGELDRIHTVLKRMGADHLRLQGASIRPGIEQPTQLLVTSWERARSLPRVLPDATGGPTRVCVTQHDFTPIRDELRERGIDFLLHADLDDESLELFFQNQLHTGPERRAEVRLQLDAIVDVRTINQLLTARLVEINSEMCRLVTLQPIDVGSAVSVLLPESLAHRADVELEGYAIRCAECEATSGDAAYSTVLELNDLTPEARGLLDQIVAGRNHGTPVTPLQGKSGSDAEPELALGRPLAPSLEPPRLPDHSPEPEFAMPEELELDEPRGPESYDRKQAVPATNRRVQRRKAYEQPVELLEFRNDGAAALGLDLSSNGVRIRGGPKVPAGSRVTVVLYSGGRDEPVLVRAHVLRCEGGELGLRFDKLTPNDRRKLDQLLSGPSMLEAVRGGQASEGRRIVSRVVADKLRD